MLQIMWARLRHISLVAAMGSLLAVSSAEAMRVSPMVSELTTTGAGSSARIEVGNIGSAALPFETLITELVMGPDGELIERPADEEFLIFPPQGVVPTGGRQVVRVQWVGDPKIETSRAFYLWVRQLPVDVEPESQGGGSLQVSVLYTMKALIVVAPPNSRPEVVVETAFPAMVTPPVPQIDPSLTGGEALPAPEPQPGIEVTLTNKGTRYALMSGATWTITGTDKSGQAYEQVMTSQQVSDAVGVGYLAPAGARRTFKIPTNGIELDAARPINIRFSR